MKIVCLTNAALVDIEISMKIQVLERKEFENTNTM